MKTEAYERDRRVTAGAQISVVVERKEKTLIQVCTLQDYKHPSAFFPNTEDRAERICLKTLL